MVTSRVLCVDCFIHVDIFIGFLCYILYKKISKCIKSVCLEIMVKFMFFKKCKNDEGWMGDMSRNVA